MSEVADMDDDRALAGEYALGLLPPEEARAFEARLTVEPALAAAYVQWAEDFARLAEDIPEETPPTRVQAALEARLFADDTPKSNWLRRFVFGGGGLVAAGLVAVVIFVNLPGSGVVPPENPIYHADLVGEQGQIVLAAGFDPATPELYVERRGTQDRPGRDIELWLIVGEAAPVSLGVLPEKERIRLPLTPEQIAGLEGGVLAISDEPEGGSPTGAPTGDVLAVGPFTNV